METSCSTSQQLRAASAHVRLRSGAWLRIESSSTATLCKLLDAIDNSFVESWRFDEANGALPSSMRHTLGAAPRILLLVSHTDWPRALHTARSAHGDLPIVAASAIPEQETAALDAGADVFCQLPLDWALFNARLRALLRRDAERRGSRSPLGAPLSLEPIGRILYVTGVPIQLSPREYDMLVPLYERREHWVPRQRLLEALSITQKGCDSSLLRMHVLNVRNKLGSKDWMLQSERTRGLMLTANQEYAAPASNRAHLQLKKA